MDYKEKYNKLVEAVKVLQETNPSDEGIRNWVNDNVPELRESKDEKTRKEIVGYLKKNLRYEWATWLEKQGTSYTKRDVDDAYIEGMAFAKDELEKQGKQNHFEQDLEMVVKPKFNIGDWITSDEPYINNDYRLCKVVGIGDGCYTIQTINGLKGYNTFKGWESEYRLWSIEDAKEGDVLARNNDILSICIFSLFDGINNKYGSFLCHCGLEGEGLGQELSINGYHDDSKDYIPATKEQRELLFEKMHEAGYEWNGEKKELKKIEQKPAWSTERRIVYESKSN